MCSFCKIFLLPNIFFYSSDTHCACCNLLPNSHRLQQGLVFYQVSSVSKPNSEAKDCFIFFLPSFLPLYPSLFSPLNVVFDSLPPADYKETMNTILVWMQQSETKLSVPQVAIAEYEIMEQRLRELKVSDQAVGTNVSTEKLRRTELLSSLKLVHESAQPCGYWVKNAHLDFRPGLQEMVIACLYWFLKLKNLKWCSPLKAIL